MRNPLVEDFFTQKMMEWASISLRDYPWRKDPRFYYVFISEFFLQRTKAAQVTPIFLDFIQEFPDYQQLKAATNVQLEQYFERLGLKKRMIYFQKILKYLQDHNKTFQDLSEKELGDLPGIGPYTLNAILCFARNKKVPIIDSNIIRIFTRFFDLQPEKKPARNDPKIWEFGNNLLPERDYNIFNYALVDFGALVCKPSNPLCDQCELHTDCFFFLDKNAGN
jgi:A/G-specific adenine glycosylase